MDALLEINKIAKTFRTSRMVVAALHDVSLTVEPGEFVSVMGPSGSGKSTLLLACGTLLAPDAGTITLRHVDPYALPSDRRAAFRARHIGFVFQQFHLIPYLNARDNIQTAASGMDAAAAARRSDELLEQFGLAGRARHLPSELSVGERQRVGLARAMLNSPPLLLADEPTGNLDETSGLVVLKALSDYVRKGAAVLMVTHDPRAAAITTRGINMNLGGLI